jgi:hypothetical protein
VTEHRSQECYETVYHAHDSNQDLNITICSSSWQFASSKICTKQNVCYKQHDCTAVQSVLSYLPHRPTVFSACDDCGILAARNRFSSHRAQQSHLLTENIVKCYLLSFHLFGVLAIAYGLRFSSSSSHHRQSLSPDFTSSKQLGEFSSRCEHHLPVSVRHSARLAVERASL